MYERWEKYTETLNLKQSFTICITINRFKYRFHATPISNLGIEIAFYNAEILHILHFTICPLFFALTNS